MEWKRENNQLTGSFAFPDFIRAWAFMTEVAMIAEKMNHHPSWTNTYNRVEIRLSTHDAGNIITDKDEILGAEILTVYQKYL